MNVLIGGGKGFIGSHLAGVLRQRGHQVTIISRTPGPKTITWDEIKRDGLPQCDAVVQLTGEGIMDKRWTESRKKVLLASRIDPTKLLVEKIKQMPNPPKVFVSGSAIGYFPTQTLTIFTEDYSGPPASDFAGQLCVAWEKASEDLKATKVRRAIVRIGVVLDAKQGAFPQMRLPLGLAFLGKIGDGKHVFPWVHVDDTANLFAFAVENEAVEGAVHAVAPQVITQGEFTSALGSVFNRPTLPLPKKVVELMFGESACLLTEGQTVVPKLTEEKYGYKFKFREIQEALKDIKSHM